MNDIKNIIEPSLKDGYIPYDICVEATKKLDCTFRDVEEVVFNSGWMPLRYARNTNSLSQEDQAKLFASNILIIGCGGIGANVAELLARLGVGKLTLFDGDIYEEHNLNRQNFSTPDKLGEPKVTTVLKALEVINPALIVDGHFANFSKENAQDFLDGADVVVDALDTPETKVWVASLCEEKSIPFVHGAIAGWHTQCTTSTNLGVLYREDGKGVEAITGNLSFTACLSACVQSAQVTKYLLGKATLRKEVWMLNLLEDESVSFPI